MARLEVPGIEIRILGRRLADARLIEKIPLRASEGAPLGRLRQGDVFSQALPAEQDLLDRVLGFEIIERDFGANEITLRLYNDDMKLFGGMEASRGQLDIFHNAVWLVNIGYPGDSIVGRTYAFVVNQIKGFKELLVRGYEDSFIRMDSKAKHRTFRSISSKGLLRSSVAARIAKDHHFSVPENAIHRSSGRFEKIVQAGITDAALLTRMAKASGHIWWIETHAKAGGLIRDFYFQPRNFFNKRGSSAVFNIGVDHTVIRDLVLDTNIFTIPWTALSAAIDPFEGTRKKYRAGNDATRRQVSGDVTPISPEMAAAAGLTLQERDEASVMWTSSGAGFPTAERLQEDLDGLWKTFEASMIKAKLVVLGAPTIEPRQIARLDGIGQLSGEYYIKTVRHTYRTGSMFETEMILLKNAFTRDSVFRADNDIMRDVRNRSNPRLPASDKALLGEGFELLSDAQPTGLTIVNVSRRKMGDQPDAETISTPTRHVASTTATESGDGPGETEPAISSR